MTGMTFYGPVATRAWSMAGQFAQCRGLILGGVACAGSANQIRAKMVRLACRSLPRTIALAQAGSMEQIATPTTPPARM